MNIDNLHKDRQTDRQRGLSVDIVLLLTHINEHCGIINVRGRSMFVVDQCSWISWVTLSHEFTFTPTICNINY